MKTYYTWRELLFCMVMFLFVLFGIHKFYTYWGEIDVQPVENPPLTDKWEALICVTLDPRVRDQPPSMLLQMEGEVEAEFEGEWVGDGQRIAQFSRNEAGTRYCSLVKTSRLDDVHGLRLDLQSAPEIEKVEVCTNGGSVSSDNGSSHTSRLYCSEVLPFEKRIYEVKLRYKSVPMSRSVWRDPQLIEY